MTLLALNKTDSDTHNIEANIITWIFDKNINLLSMSLLDFAFSKPKPIAVAQVLIAI